MEKAENMEAISINRKKAVRYHVISFVVNSFLAFLVFMIFNALMSFLGIPVLAYEVFGISLYFWVIFLILGWNLFALFYEYIIVRSLKYWFSPSRLVRQYYFVGKTKDAARLQIVNDVFIEQDWKERLLDIFRVRVTYGFASEGYSFTYDYLSEKDAESIAGRIKPKGLGVEIR